LPRRRPSAASTSSLASASAGAPSPASARAPRALTQSGVFPTLGPGVDPTEAAKRYRSRELAWLDFDERVLEEALDPDVPLLERLKFLAIFSSNLDEFFMVRIAGLKRQIDAGVDVRGPDGRTPREIFDALGRRLHELVARQHDAFENDLRPRLSAVSVRLLDPDALDDEQRAWLALFFRRTILPVVTPLAIDPGHPFPHLANRTICLAVGLRKRDLDDDLPASKLAIVHIPSSVIPRFIRLPAAPCAYAFISLEDAIRAHATELFAGYEVVSCHALRVTRDSDLEINEETAGDLLYTIEEALRQRRMGAAVRLQYDARLPRWILDMLADKLEVEEQDLFPIDGRIAFSDLLQLYAEVDLKDLRDPPHVPQRVPALDAGPSTFAAIRRRDVLLHHPYQSFDHVVRFLREAADDPAVLAIKMTLYRVGGASPIVEALQAAAHQGKQVAVLMELKARFDESANIDWARKLEDAGAHVMYGLPGLKTHAKACLVVRKDPDGIRRYCHLGTGNYNARTAQIYSDFGLFTCRDEICDEVASVFNLITGYCRPPALAYLSVAPIGLRQRIYGLIRREKAYAAAGKPARITAKMNGLEDIPVIDELYAAAAAGVEIDLIVRGICCLRPGVPGLSERIRVTRIVDGFLEHARAFVFENGGDPEYYLSSADWMPRNLDRRIELMFPVHDPDLRAEIAQVLSIQLADDAKARQVGPDGENRRRPVAQRVRSQRLLADLAAERARGRA